MFAQAMDYYYKTGKKKVSTVDPINLKLDKKKDLLYILIALIKTGASTLVRDDDQIDLTARMMIQASQLLTPEELSELGNLLK